MVSNMHRLLLRKGRNIRSNSDFQTFFEEFRMLNHKNKAQIYTTREHQRPRELPGPLSGPWTPAVRDFGFRVRDVHAHTVIIYCAPLNENPGSAPALNDILVESRLDTPFKPLSLPFVLQLNY